MTGPQAAWHDEPDYEIDSLGMLENVEPRESAYPAEVPDAKQRPDVAIEPVRAPVPPQEVPRMPAAAERLEADAWSMVDRSIGVEGGHNSVAGRDIDQSRRLFEHARILMIAGEQSEPPQAQARNRARDGQWDTEALERLVTRYVPPPGLLDDTDQSAFQILRDRRSVLLGAAEEDGGQFTAALRLAQELRVKVDSSLIVRREEPDQGFQLDSELILDESSPAAVVLDLREASPSELNDVRKRLVEFCSHLDTTRSYLITILPGGQRRRFAEEFPSRSHELARPSGVAVFTHHVELVPDPQAFLAESGLLDKVEQAWPPEAKALADAVSDARRDGVEVPAEIASRVSDPTDARIRDLRVAVDKFQNERNERSIGLLLACGLFEGMRSDQLLATADLVLADFGAEEPDPSPLLRRGVTATLETLGEGLFDVSQRSFVQPRLGAAVLPYFWSEHPALRSGIRSWLGEIPAKIRDLDQSELERLADRTAELAGHAGIEVITSVAQEWATSHQGRVSKGTELSNGRQDQSRRSVAVRLLTKTATDPVLGRSVRDRLWDWSTRSPAPDIQLLVAQVCAEIGQDFPRVALTRLKHLSRSPNPMVRESVADALVRIGGEIGFSQFLHYIEDWINRPDPDRIGLLADGFEQLLAARPASSSADGVQEFWSRVLDEVPLTEIRRMVGAWLRAGALATSAAARDKAVEALVTATEGRTQRIARLQWASRVAAIPLDPTYVEDDPVNILVQQVWTRLDEVDPIRTRREEENPE